jgi:hypothetical protein
MRQYFHFFPLSDFVLFLTWAKNVKLAVGREGELRLRVRPKAGHFGIQLPARPFTDGLHQSREFASTASIPINE